MPTTFGVYPYEDQLTAGDEISSTYEGRHITLKASELMSSGGSQVAIKGLPVVFGLSGKYGVGIAFKSTSTASDLVAIDTEGIWNVDVWARNDGGDIAVNGGDPLYIDTTAGSNIVSKITNLATQIPFGYALGVVTSSDTKAIAVKVHFDPHYDIDMQVFKTLDEADPSANFGAYAAAFKMVVDSDIIQTGGRLCAMSINLNPASGLEAQAVMGGEVCVYLAADIPVAGMLTGLYVEIQGGLSYASDVHSLFVYLALTEAPTGASNLARFEHNSTYSYIDEFISLVGDAPAAFSFGPLAENNAWSKDTAPNGGASGHIHILIGGELREIPLHTPA